MEVWCQHLHRDSLEAVTGTSFCIHSEGDENAMTSDREAVLQTGLSAQRHLLRGSATQATMMAGGVFLLAAALLVPAAGAGIANSRRPDLLPRDCGRRLLSPADIVTPFIVGTGDVTAYYGEFPWQAHIEAYKPESRTYGHQCGGIIITRWHVLTAAHCVDHVSLSSMQVRVGDLQLGRTEGAEQVYGVANFLIHNEFGQGTNYANDIALLYLNVRHGVGIEFGRFVQPACLPEADTKYEPDTVCEVSGWGKTSDGAPVSETLRGASVPLVSDEFCTAPEVHQDRFLSGRMFCAGLVRGGPDSCGGDSGGPLVCRDPTTNRFVTYGIVSSGDPKGCGKLPGLYTKVSGFVSWLLERLELDLGDRFDSKPMPDSKPISVASADPEIDCGRSGFSPPANARQTFVTDSADFPWLVSIYIKTFKLWCSGTVVSDRWIMAGEWCVEDAYSDETPFAAVLDVTTGEPVKKFDLVRREKYPASSPASGRGIVLLQTLRPMPFVNNLRPICLPDKQVPEVGVGATIALASWEDPRPFNGSRGVLQWTKMSVVDTPCSAGFAFCARFGTPTRPSDCNFLSDPGAPVMAKATVNGVGRWYLVSMHSQSASCETNTPLSVPFTIQMVDAIEWIRSVIANK